MPVPEHLTREERQKLVKFVRDGYPQFNHNNPGGLRDLVESCLDYYREKDEERRDWLAVIRQWIRRQAKWDFDRSGRRGSLEKPQMVRGRKQAKEELRPLQRLFDDESEDLLE